MAAQKNAKVLWRPHGEPHLILRLDHDGDHAKIFLPETSFLRLQSTFDSNFPSRSEARKSTIEINCTVSQPSDSTTYFIVSAEWPKAGIPHVGPALNQRGQSKKVAGACPGQLRFEPKLNEQGRSVGYRETKAPL